MSKINFGDTLYNLLPEIYRQKDSQQLPVPYPLKRFFQVVGTGMNFIEDKLDGQLNMYDLDNTPPEFLPYLYGMMGFDFPYFMTVYEQRSMLKALPFLYKLKGTTQVFSYLARVIFGGSSSLVAVSRVGSNIDIDMTVVTGDGAAEFTRKQTNFNYFAEFFRPVNTRLHVLIAVFYDEVYTAAKLDSVSDVTKVFSSIGLGRLGNMNIGITDVSTALPVTYSV